MTTTIHQGRNVKRIREILGIKQEALAADLGESWNQKKISLLEDKEVLEIKNLEAISEVFKIPVNIITDFDGSKLLKTLAGTFDGVVTQDKDVKQLALISYVLNLYYDRIALYDRMIKDNEEMASWVMSEIL